MRNFFILLAAALTTFSAGCASRVVVSEVLQQPKDAPIYTKYNLWYNDPLEIDSRNVQQGRLLPLGSKVEIIDASSKMLHFKTDDGGVYKIDFDSGVWMCSMREFIRSYLTLEEPSKFLAGIRPQALPFVKRGEVTANMTREEVLAAYGPPPTARTPSLKNETWIYYVTPRTTIRVVFRDNLVRNVINPNE